MLKELIERLKDRVELPIEVQEIAQLLIELGCQDEIRFYPVDADRAAIRGAFYQFTYHGAPYGDPQLVTLIPYNSSDPIEMQRLVCCKEMMHLFDREIEKTNSEEELSEFLDKLLGPLTTDDFGLADFMAAKDKIAAYQCLPLLMPEAALNLARAAVARGERTPAEVAEWAQLPVGFVRFMLDEQWDTVNGTLHR